MSRGLVVERRFLLRGKFPARRLLAGVDIETGYLSARGSREVALIKEDGRRRMVVREGRSRQSKETEMPIGAAAFQALWEETAGLRVHKTRYRLTLAGFPVVVDEYRGALAPLKIGMVMLPVCEALPEALKPYFGREVDGAGEYSESQLALHGGAPTLDGSIQAGALPFLFKDGILHVVLVTSSSGQKWLVPKGRLERSMTREEVALMEAAEEAGVVGVIEPGVAGRCVLEDGRELRLFPLRVATLLPVWPERLQRRRVVLPIYRALVRIGDPGLERCVRELSRKLTP